MLLSTSTIFFGGCLHPNRWPRRPTPWDDLDQALRYKRDPRATNEKGTKGPTRDPDVGPGGGSWEEPNFQAVQGLSGIFQIFLARQTGGERSFGG